MSKTISLVSKGEIVDNFEYALEDTPCANVANDSICCYTDNVVNLFPKDQLLIDMNIKGYIGSPLHDSKGNVIGITVALSEKPIENEDMIVTLFEIFSGRIAVEMERVEQDIEILRLSQVVNQNPFSTILTDKEGIIQYVNKQTVVMSGYEEEELIGKAMNIFSSKLHSKEFYEDLWNTILNKRQIWRGTIINKMKNGKHLDCSSNIFPLFDEQNEITNFVTVQEDITELNIKDKLFFMQTRQAQMGEMLSMIAHQWRQPLGSISTTVIDMLIKIELEKIQLKDEDKQYVSNNLNRITGYIQSLSTTIDDFRNFYKPNKQSDNLKLEEVCKKSLAIIKTSLINNNINIVESYHSNDTLKIYTNEIVQVVLNILKNVEDNFLEKNIKAPFVKISTNDKALSICDNGGGIPEDILPKIFDPYFSTKNERNGTGLGLYMSKIIIEAHHNAKLIAVNTVDGICFKIEFEDE